MKIGIADTLPLQDEHLYQKVYESLPVARREKADSLKVQSAQNQSVAAGWLLTKFAGAFSKGRPCVSMAEREKAGGGQTDDITYYNLSHSGELAACVVAEYPVGIDIEIVKKCRMGVAEKWFSEAECLWLEQAETESERAELFTKIWTQKESAAKLTGEGIARILAGKGAKEVKIRTDSVRLEKGADIYYLTVAVYLGDKDLLPQKPLTVSRIGYETVEGKGLCE